MKLKFKDGTIIEVTDIKGLSKEEIIAEAKQVYKDFKDSQKSVKDEEPKQEEPKQEESKKEEPKQEEPKQDDPMPTEEEIKKELDVVYDIDKNFKEEWNNARYYIKYPTFNAKAILIIFLLNRDLGRHYDTKDEKLKEYVINIIDKIVPVTKTIFNKIIEELSEKGIYSYYNVKKNTNGDVVIQFYRCDSTDDIYKFDKIIEKVLKPNEFKKRKYEDHTMSYPNTVFEYTIPKEIANKSADSETVNDSKVKDEPIYLGTEKLKKLDKKGLFALVKSKGGEEFNDEYYLTYKNKPQKKIEAENDKAAVKNFRELVKSGNLVATDSIKDALSKEFIEQINKEIGGRPFEIENENTGDFEVYYVELEEDGFLYAGSVANVGFLPNQELCVKYDEDYTLDENLQSLYEVIINKMYETPTIEDTQIRDDSALVSKVNNYLAETAGMPNVTYKDENLYTYILKLIDKKLNIAFNYEAAEGKNIELVLSYDYEVKKNPAALKTNKKEDFIKITSVTFSNGEVNGTEVSPEDEAAAKEALNKIKSDPQIIKMIINYYRKEINAEMYSWAIDFGGFDTEDLEGEFDENGEWNPRV